MANSEMMTPQQIPVIKSSKLTITGTLLNCTGTLNSDDLCIYDHGDFIYCVGRIRITNYSRTGAAPGVTIKLPTGITVKNTLSINIGGSVANENTAKPESVFITASAGSGDITFRATETIGNLTGTARLTLHIPTTLIAINHS